ncbi:MAG: hypothetical protein MUC67_04095 [Acidobacteria bacterium]|nr:hypothetical protein [Acidobacteriota bacterium]MCU0254545.1 hypothetical protein [Acidobacteriota bacterium]
MATEHEKVHSGSVKERAREELRRFLIVSAYLFVCLLAILVYRMVLLHDRGLHSLSLGFAAGKALILGKFLLIGEAVDVGRRVRARTLLERIAYRVVLMGLLLIVLTIVEEVVVGWFHGHSVSQTLAEMLAQSVPMILTHCVLMLLILVPLITFTEVDAALGVGTLRRVLLAPPTAERDARRPSGESTGRRP